MKPTLLFLMLVFAFSACQNTSSESSEERIESTEPESIHNHLTEAEKAEGWQLLFDGKTADKWRGYGKDSLPGKGWTVEEGMLKVQKGGGDLITKEQFGNFELKIDFALTDTANSGIFYLAIEKPEDAIWKFAPEYQLLDNQTYINMYGDMSKHLTGENYDLHEAKEDHTNPVGEWNTARILHNNGHVEHWLNGYQTVEYELGSEAWKYLVQNSKFVDYPEYGQAKVGHIGLQDHGHLVMFRNLKIRKL